MPDPTVTDDAVRGHIEGWDWNLDDTFVTLHITVPSTRLGKFDDKKPVILSQITEKESGLMPDQTPVTDDDRKAHEWADRFEETPHAYADALSFVARAIRAHVPAPPKSLADELREWFNLHHMEHMDSFSALAKRAESVETKLRDTRVQAQEEIKSRKRAEIDRDEARAEVEQLKSDINMAYDEVNRRTDEHTWPRVTPSGHTYNEPTTYEKLCILGSNVAQAAVEQWDDSEFPPEPTWEMVGLATAEVERLTAERENQEKALTEHGRLLSEARAEAERLKRDLEKAYKERDAMDREASDLLAEVERLTGERTRKESLPVALPDPADVPEGEVWLVTVSGVRGVGFRHGGSMYAWGVAYEGGIDDEEDSSVTLIARLVPDVRRVIDRPEDLDALPVGSIVLDEDGDPWQKKTNREWEGLLMTLDSEDMIDCHNSVTVIHEPEVTA